MRSTIVLLALLAGILPAQAVSIGGFLSDATTGPLAGNTTYQVTSNITVQAGTTLTIQSGAILKFNLGTTIDIDGTLLADGATFTASTDDSVGIPLVSGSSTGTPGHWNGLRFDPGSDSSMVSGCTVRYAGRSGTSAIRISATDPTFTGVTILDCGGDGFDLNGNSTPTLTSCDVQRTRVAYDRIRIDALANFTGNTASNNVISDVPVVTSGTVSAPLELTTSNLVGSAVAMNANLVVDAGATLTVRPGVIFKQSLGTSWTIRGTLNVTASAANPVIISSFADDTAGGDTNKNGAATSPNRGDWNFVSLREDADASVLSGLEVRYAGRSSTSAIQLNECDATLTDVLVRDAGGDGFDLFSNSFPTLTACRVERVNGIAIDRVDVMSLPGFTNNTAVDCNLGNFPSINPSTVNAALDLERRMLIGDVLVPAGSFTVAAGATLTVEPGIAFKFRLGATVNVDGDLIAEGTSAAPISFTSLDDDTILGDTNRNGAATTPVRGNWIQVRLNATATASRLRHVLIRWAGRSSIPALDLRGTQLVDRVTVEECGGDAVSLVTAARPTITDSVFRNCTGVAVDAVPLEALAGFSGNTATGNGLGNAVRITNTTLNADLTIDPDQGFDAGFWLAASVNVPSGLTLTLNAGTVFKAQLGLQHIVNGTLLANGSASSPVVFTSLADDAFGGDTQNNLGATAPSPGQWVGLDFRGTTNSSILTDAIVRYAGRSSITAINLAGTVRLERVLSELNGGPALRLASTSARPTVENCRFETSTYAIDGVDIDSVPGFRHNEASGNSLGNYMRITGGSCDDTTVIHPYNYPNEALVGTSGFTVLSGGDLTLGRGTIVKLGLGGQLVASAGGELNIDGTGFEPVIVTSISDDEIGGDTNLNGTATGPVPGELTGVRWNASSSSSTASNLLVRYAGRSGTAAIAILSDLATPRNMRAEYSGGIGIQVGRMGGDAQNFIAFNCASDGIRVDSGFTFDLVHATAVGCSNGVRSFGWTGVAVNSIAWDNTTNWNGFNATNLFNSNGSPTLAGMNGNLNLDPGFIDPTTGNLNLVFFSPLINVGDLLRGFDVTSDWSDQPRVADGLLNGTLLPDMGAIEFVPFLLNVVGEPQMGGTIVFRVLGPPGVAAIFFGTEEGSFVDPVYGIGLTGDLLNTFVLTVQPVDTDYVVTLGNDPALDGFTATVQAAAVADLFQPRGTFTGAYRGRIFR